METDEMVYPQIDDVVDVNTPCSHPIAREIMATGGTQPPTLIDGKLPVFVFPTSLTFYSDDQSTHKQILTLYNPYEFALKFKVLCTSPRKYTVVDSEGIIKPRCCVDIVVRHTDIAINQEGVKTKFRIHVSEYGQRTIIGKKDIPSVLLPTREKTQTAEEQFESMPVIPGVQPQEAGTARRGTASPSLVVVAAAILCIIALMMPSVGETQSRLPDYLHLSGQQKLIAAYILGLVTMAVLRS